MFNDFIEGYVAKYNRNAGIEMGIQRVDNLTPAQQSQIRVLLSDYFKDIPAPEQLRRKLQELDEAIQRGNIDRQFGVIEQINGLIAQRISDQQGLDEILRGIEGEETFDLDEEAERQDDRQEELTEAFAQVGSDEARRYFNMTDVEQEIGSNRAKITAFLYHTDLFDGVTQLSTGERLTRSAMRTRLTADQVEEVLLNQEKISSKRKLSLLARNQNLTYHLENTISIDRN
jgi:predicted RND superfamily exporter protein